MNPGQRSAIASAYTRLPLSFEPNQGQAPDAAKFIARGQGYTLLLNSNVTTLALHRGRPLRRRGGMEAGPMDFSEPPVALQLRLLGANASAAAVAEDRLPGKSNYFIGNHRSQWRPNVPNYGRVRYRGVYPGIDVVYYGNQRLLEHDFELAPGADPRKIRLSFDGIKGAEIAPSGDLVLHVADGEVRLQRPVVYQTTEKGRREIAGGFVLRGREVSFAVGDYDRSRTLVIDPKLVYSTYLGGTSGFDLGFAVATDSTGNAYVTGEACSTNFPTTSGVLKTVESGCDAFVTKINPAGSALIFATFLGGSSVDRGFGVALDSSNNVYVTGYTHSTDFPIAGAPVQSSLGGRADAFAVKLSSTGSALIFSTYLGGAGFDEGMGIAVDLSGNAYVVGDTKSLTFPTLGPLQFASSGGVFTSTTAGASWTMHRAGLATGYITAMAVPPGGSGVVFAGTEGGEIYKSTDSGATWTLSSTGLITTTYLQTIRAILFDATTPATMYVATPTGVFKSTNSGANWAALNSGLNPADVNALAQDPAGNLYAATQAGVFKLASGSSTWVPSSTGLPACNGCTSPAAVNAIVADPTPLPPAHLYVAISGFGVYKSVDSGNTWTAANGGSTNPLPSLVVQAIAIDPRSPDTLYVNSNALSKTVDGGANWTPAFSGLTDGAVKTIVVDPNLANTVYVGTQSGGSSSGVFESTNGGATWSPVNTGLTTRTIASLAIDPANSNNLYVGTSYRDAFVTALSPSGNLLYSTYLGGSDDDAAFGVAVDSTGNAYVTGFTASGDFPLSISAPPKNPFNEAFVTKISPAGALVYSFYLGGNSTDTGYAIAVDGSGDAFVTGLTCSSDFPVTGGVFQPADGGGCDAFVTELDPTGASRIYSTFLGGGGYDQGSGIALDGNGNAWVAGNTSSPNFPVANARQPVLGGGNDAFVAEIAPGGTTLKFSTFLGGSGEDIPRGLAANSAGAVLVTGYTSSADFPAQSLFSTYSSGYDAFVAAFQDAQQNSDVFFQSPVTAPTSASSGTTIAYSMVLSNAGPSQVNGSAANVGLTLGLAGTPFRYVSATGGTCAALATGVNCTVGDIPVGSFASLTINVEPLAAGTLTATAFVRTDDNDPNPANNTSGPIATIVTASFDLSVSMTHAPDPVAASTGTSTFQYTSTVTITNNLDPITGASLTFNLPSGTTFVSYNQPGTSASVSCTTGPGLANCALPAMAHAQIITINFVLTTPNVTPPAAVTNTASLTSTPVGTSQPNPSATDTVNVATLVDLRITAAPSSSFVPVGGSAAFVITISNIGGNTATFPFGQIDLPLGMSYVGFSSPRSGVSCSQDGPVFCSLPDLVAGDSFTVTILATAVQQGFYTANMSFSSSGTDSNPANNSTSASVTFTGGLNSQLTTLVSDFETSTVQGFNTSSSGGGQITNPILAGASPTNIVIAPNGRLAFVANVNASYVSVVDLTIQAEITRIRDVRAWSLAMTSDGAKLAAVAQTRDELDIIDVATLAVTRISLDGKVGDAVGANDIHPFSLALVGYRAYVLNEFGPVISVDFSALPSPATIATVPNTAGMVSLPVSGHRIAASPDGSTVVVFGRPIAGGNALVYLITTSTNTAQTVATTFANARSLAITPNPSALTGVIAYLARPGDISTLDLRTGSPTFGQLLSGTVTVTGTIQDIAITPDGATVQVVTGVAQGAAGTPSSLITLSASSILASSPSAVLSTVSIPSSISVRGLAIGYVQNFALSSAPQVFDVQPPVITNEAPKTVTILGDNFAAGALVRIGNLDPLPSTFVSVHELTVTVPAAAAVQNGTIIVTLPNSAAGPLAANVSGSGSNNGVMLRIDPPPTFAPLHPVAVASFSTANLALLFRDSSLVPGGPESFSLALSPDGLFAYGGVWELDITNLDAQQLQTAAIYPNGFGSSGDGIAIAPDPVSGKKVAYLVSADTATASSDTLYIVDVDPSSTTTRNTLLRTIQAAPTDLNYPQGLAVTPNGRFVYSVDANLTNGGSRLVIFDVLNGTSTVISDITTLGADINQAHIQVTPDGASLLMSGTGTTGIKVYDIASNPLAPALVATITGSGAPTSNPPLFYWFQVVGTTSPRLFAYASDQRYVQAFDFISRTALGSYTIPSAPGAFAGSAMAVTPEGNLIYAVLENEDAVAVLDANLVASSSPNALITKMRTAVNPSVVAVSPRGNATADLVAGIDTSAPIAVEGGPANAALDQPFDIQISIQNDGPALATGTSMVLAIPAGIQVNSSVITDSSGIANFTCAVTSTQVTCPVGNLGLYDFVSVHVNVTATALGSYSFTNTVAGNELDPVLADNTASLTVDVGGGADVAITVSASPTPAVGGSPATLTAVVTNSGPAVASAVSASLFFSYISPPSFATTQGTCTTFGTCSLGDIAPGGSVTITATTTFGVVNVPPSGTVSITGTASSSTADPNTNNNFFTLDLPLTNPAAGVARYLVTDRGISQLRIYNPGNNVPLAQPIQAGISAVATALSPNRRLAFTANLNANYISVLDLSIQREIYRIRGIRAANVGLTADGSRLVAPLQGGDAVAIIDAATFQVLQTVNLNGLVGDSAASTTDIQFGGMVMVGSKAYLNLFTGTASTVTPVVVIDATNGSVAMVAGIVGQGSSFPGNTNIAATPDGLNVLTVRVVSGCGAVASPCPVQIISTGSNSVVGQVTGAQANAGSRLAISPANPNGVFGYLSRGARLDTIDLRPGSATFGELLPSAAVTLPFNPTYLTVSLDGTRVYASSTSPSTPYDFAVVDAGLLQSAPSSSVIYFARLAAAGLRAVLSGLIDALPEVGAPQITGVQPAFFFNDAPATLTISGSGFAPDSLVKIGNLDPLPVAFLSSNQVQLTVPAGAAAQSADVVVTNPNSTGPVTQQWLSGVAGTNSVPDLTVEISSPLTYQPKFEAIVSNFGDGTLKRLSHNNSQFVTPTPMGLAFTPDGTQVYTESFYLSQAVAATLNGSPTIIPFDLAAGVGQAGQNEGIAVALNPASGQPVAYAASATLDSSTGIYGEKLNLIDANPFSPSFNTIIDAIAAPALDTSPSRGALAVTPDGNYVYENAFPSSTAFGSIVIFDTVGRTVTSIGTDTLGVATFQPRMLVTSDGHWLLLEDVSGTVKVFDISSTPLAPAAVATAVVPFTPAGMTAPQFDSFAVAGSHLYAFDHYQNLVEVFNFNPGGGNLSFVNYFVGPGHTFPLYSGLAVAPDESLIYVAQAADDSVAVLDAAKVIAGDPTALVTRFAAGVGPEVVALSPKRIDTATSDFAITITHSPNPVPLGSNITYDVTLTNYGPFDVSGGNGAGSGGFLITFDKTLVPVSTTFSNSPFVNCNLNGQQLLCGFSNGGPNLGPPPVSISGNLVLQTTAVGNVTAQAYVDGGKSAYDPNSANNSSTDLASVVAADLGLTMTASPTTLAPNANLTYSITVVNNGPSDSTGFILTDTLPAGVTFAGASSSTGCTAATSTVTCVGPALALGQSTTLIIVVTPAAQATLTNSAVVTGNEVDPVPGNNSASVQNFAVASDISVVAGGAPTPIGGLPAYTATVTNNGPTDATGVVLTDFLDNFAFVSATSTQGSCNFTAPNLTCNIGNLANGASVVVTVVVNAPKQGWAANTFHANAAQPDPNPTNNAVRIGPPIDSFNTPVGTDVSISTTDLADGVMAAVTFSNVTRTGSTTMGPLSAAGLPPGFRTGRQPTIFDLSTNAEFTGAIALNIHFVAANFHHPALVRLFHYEAGAWVDRTTGVDAVSGLIAGRVLSLSPFALLEPLDNIPVASAGADRTVPGAMAAGARVTLDGSTSSDADGDLLTYRWSGLFPEGSGTVTGANPMVTLPLGVSRVSLVVNDGEADSPAVAVNIAVADFQLSAPSGSVTLNRGQSTTFTINSTPQYGAFAAPVNLSCAPGSPDVTCSFSAASIMPGASGATATLTVTAAASVARVPSRSAPRQFALWFGTLPLFGVVFLAAGRRRKVHRASHLPAVGRCGSLSVLLMLLLVLLAVHVGCGGGGTTQTPGSSSPTTPGAKAVTVIVTGTSGTLQHTSSVTVTIPQ